MIDDIYHTMCGRCAATIPSTTMNYRQFFWKFFTPASFYICVPFSRGFQCF